MVASHKSELGVHRLSGLAPSQPPIPGSNVLVLLDLMSKERALSGEMDEEKMSKFFKAIDIVDLTGFGEPLLNSHFTDMVRILKENDCTVSFTTNATVLTPERSRELIELGLDIIDISLDGGSPEVFETIRRGAKFDEVINNICQLSSEASPQTVE